MCLALSLQRRAESESEREREITLWSTRMAVRNDGPAFYPLDRRNMSGEQPCAGNCRSACRSARLLVTKKKRPPPLLNRAAKLQPIKLTVHGNSPQTVDLSVITSLISAPYISDSIQHDD